MAIKIQLVSKSNPDIKFNLDESLEVINGEKFAEDLQQSLAKDSDLEVVVTYQK